jgi:hypothetical protein
MICLRWLLLCLPVAAWAEGPFEIQVFEYEPLPRGAYAYEEHINYPPDAGVLHLSSESTAGINDEFRAGLMVLTAAVPGRGMEYAGFRVLTHFYAPQSWRSPVNLGAIAEFSFERPGFDEDTRRMELRGIVEKYLGRLELDHNLVFARSFRGPGTHHGWEIEPSARIGWQAWRMLTPSVEYYGAPSDHTHLAFLGGDWKIRERVTWNFGVGSDLIAGKRDVILKSRLEFEFGRRSHTGQ